MAASDVRWHFTLPTRAFVLIALAIAVLPFTGALLALFDLWNLKPEYSHGILIPLISLFLVWRQRHVLAAMPFEGSWSGVFIIAGGLTLWLVGELSTIPVIVQYGFLLVLYGLVVALVGWRVLRYLWMPLVILFFAIPLPAFFANTLSLNLQLLSSAIGVAVIRLAGISVFLEGNVIDLGAYKLQVAEACNGLRYLFPLMTLAFIVAYFFRAPLWQRAVLFLASIPIAILMNSLRIAVIGVTVEYWGVQMAEGVLHDFEGWVVFMASLFVLLGVAVLLARLRGVKGGLREVLVFDLGTSAPPAGETTSVRRRLPRPFVAAAALGATCAIMGFAMPERSEAQPTRADLTSFPTDIDGWHGRRAAMEQVYLDTLQLDDYLLADYVRAGAHVPVNLYIAWYDSQRNGRSAHSPRACLPGGGWVIRSLEQRELTVGGKRLRANRAIIELGRERQVVYYWFQQRGRDITNEYLVKWYLFWDALTRNRTDGALVRLTAAVLPGMDEARADSIVAQFAAAALPNLGSYIPE